MPIADIYQEIILLSGMADRAELRNRSFAEKLGVRASSRENKEQMEEEKTKE